MCVYDQNYAIVIVTQQKEEECAIRLDRKTQFFISHSTLQNHFLSGSKQFWRTKILYECYGAFVCV